MSRYYLVGGRQRRRASWMEEWHHYEKALVAELDTETGGLELRLEYETPAEACAADPQPGILFKAATLEGRELHLCTQTEVMAVEVPSFRRTAYVSLPCFNDVHHVRPTPRGTWLVVSTGLDLLLEVTREGEVLAEWGVLGQDPWEHFSRDADYRKVLTTKPHASHPNYVFLLGDDVWVTRLEQRDAICLTGHGRIELGAAPPHDGVLRAGRLHFTTVDGTLRVFDAETRSPRECVDLSSYWERPRSVELGWCRGIEPVDEARMLVGFSALRPTAFRENLRWLKSRAQGREPVRSLPTRVALVDLEAGRLVWEKELSAVGMDAVFSIHRVPDGEATS